LRSTTSFSQICAINVIRNNYFFFTSTPVMWMCLNVMLYWHCLSCYNVTMILLALPVNEKSAIVLMHACVHGANTIFYRYI
jgi:hypothetical protein